jgi:hypothetical protein
VLAALSFNLIAMGLGNRPEASREALPSAAGRLRDET